MAERASATARGGAWEEGGERWSGAEPAGSGLKGDDSLKAQKSFLLGR